MISIAVFTNCNNSKEINKNDVQSAEKIAGLELTGIERDSLMDGLNTVVEDYETNRKVEVKNSVSPKIMFDPRPINYSNEDVQQPIDWQIPLNIDLPENRDQLAFYSVSELASLIQQKKISSQELTQFFLDRLKKYSDTLECLVTLTENLALQQAKKADDEIANGIYRGPLHGIPFGVKDLFAVAGYKTTWGAMPFKDQEVEGTATVIEKLDMVGLLAVEMFLDKEGQIFVNEIAPRPHNSGHQTIEANVTSQYEQHLRAIFNMPLGDTGILQPSAMVNLLGEPGYEGLARYEGLEKVLAVNGAHVHLYGKKITKPYRKMGHVTIVDNKEQRLFDKADFIKRTLKIKA